jgi:hypothetical protein
MGVRVMKSYARIENNTVVEIIETDGDIATLFHPSLEFIDCTNIAGVKVGWIKENGSLIAPPGPDIDELKHIMASANYDAAQNRKLVAAAQTGAMSEAIALLDQKPLQATGIGAINYAQCRQRKLISAAKKGSVTEAIKILT